MNRPSAAADLLPKAIAQHQSGRLSEAAALYQQVLSIEPNNSRALHNLGVIAQHERRHEDAIVLIGKAIKLEADNPGYHYNLGTAYHALQRSEEAAVHYRRVLAIMPNFAPALNNLSRLLFEKGDVAEALVLNMRSLAGAATDEGKSLFVDYVRHYAITGRPVKPINGVLPVLVRAIKERWASPNELMAPMEKFVCAARAAMLDRAARPDAVAEDILAFYTSIAIQCFTAEFVFSASEKENAQAEQARDDLAAALASGTDIAPVLLVAVAAYYPLIGVSGAEKLLQRKWPMAIARLVDRQLREPLKERELRKSIPKLTPIEDRVSRLVQEQYEENPYPRWVETAESWGRPKRIDEYLSALFPLAPLSALGKGGAIDILIAGTGTGRQAIETARQFPEARVLAVDLSVAALAYAKRKSDELRVKNIEYGQADIVEIGALGRRFDVIYASGVLHHLADPFAGWRGLLENLVPCGLMNVGLYSEKGREDIVAAQRFVAKKGFKPTTNDIRGCREEFERLPAESPLRNVMLLLDFYSMSDLRDLLFHVQEHRMSLPQIALFLAENNLQFLGFEQEPDILQRYREKFPEDKAMTNLALWDHFEQENPRAFTGMYQFWLQKARG